MMATVLIVGWLMVGWLMTIWLMVGSFYFAITHWRSPALTAVVLVVLECFAEGVMKFGDVAAAFAATADGKDSDKELDGTAAAADAAAAAMVPLGAC